MDNPLKPPHLQGRDVNKSNSIMNPTDGIKATSDHCLRVYNDLLRSELAAVETYGQAMEQYASSPAVAELSRIRLEHVQCAKKLVADVRQIGGRPAMNSGPWALFTSAVRGTLHLFGAGSVIEYLKKGEETARRAYQRALQDDRVRSDFKQSIRENFLPKVNDHIWWLDRLQRAA
jgi:bacterioferritin (cytochrome b1)